MPISRSAKNIKIIKRLYTEMYWIAKKYENSPTRELKEQSKSCGEVASLLSDVLNHQGLKLFHTVVPPNLNGTFHLSENDRFYAEELAYTEVE